MPKGETIMTLATVYTRAALGIQAPEVRIEAHIGNGLPGFTWWVYRKRPYAKPKIGYAVPC